MRSTAHVHVSYFLHWALWELGLCSRMPTCLRLAVLEVTKSFPSKTVTGSKYLLVGCDLTSFGAFDIGNEDTMLRKVFSLEKKWQNPCQLTVDVEEKHIRLAENLGSTRNECPCTSLCATEKEADRVTRSQKTFWLLGIAPQVVRSASSLNRQSISVLPYKNQLKDYCSFPGNPLSMMAREAGRLTTYLHPTLHSPKSNLAGSPPAL